MFLLSVKREDMWSGAQTYSFCEQARVKKADSWDLDSRLGRDLGGRQIDRCRR